MSWKIFFSDRAGRPAESVEIRGKDEALRYAANLQYKQGCQVRHIRRTLSGEEIAGFDLQKLLTEVYVAMEQRGRTQVSGGLTQ